MAGNENPVRYIDGGGIRIRCYWPYDNFAWRYASPPDERIVEENKRKRHPERRS